MASYVMHYAISKQYAKTHEVKDFDEFLKGAFWADRDESVKRHFTFISPIGDYKKYVESKVSLSSFTREYKLDSDFVRGYFLHLIADYLLNHDYFLDKLDVMPDFWDEIINISNEYNCLNIPIYKEYDLDLTKVDKSLEKYFDMETLYPEPSYLKVNEMINFINFCATLDLDYWYEQAKTGIYPHYKIIHRR